MPLPRIPRSDPTLCELASYALKAWQNRMGGLRVQVLARTSSTCCGCMASGAPPEGLLTASCKASSRSDDANKPNSQGPSGLRTCQVPDGVTPQTLAAKALVSDPSTKLVRPCILKLQPTRSCPSLQPWVKTLLQLDRGPGGIEHFARRLEDPRTRKQLHRRDLSARFFWGATAPTSHLRN